MGKNEMMATQITVTDEMNFEKLKQDINAQETSHLTPPESYTATTVTLKNMRNEKTATLKTETDETLNDLLSLDGNEIVTLSHINVI